MKRNNEIEKRRFQRFGCCVPAQCKRLGDIRKELSGALTKNVSLGGTRLMTQNFIPFNSRLVLLLSFPFTNQSVKILCKVAWTKRFETLSRYDIGIEFIDMTAKVRNDISHLLKNKNLN